jgi:hypothetical protein
LAWRSRAPKELEQHAETLQESDIYTLRRIVPAERGELWGERA